MPLKKKVQGFSRAAVKATDYDWSKIRGYNVVLKRLSKRRIKRLARTGKYEISQIAMQAEILQQSLLYRIVSLATSTARNWNVGNVVGATLAARALLETIAQAHRVEGELSDFAAKGDWNGLHKHAVNLTFATRDEEMQARDAEIQAKNVVTYIDHFDKQMPGIKKHYEFLCEWCHPNVFGHYGAFASYDKAKNIVTFCERKMYCHEMLDTILAAYSLLDPLAGLFDSWDRTIARAAKVQSERAPPPEDAQAGEIRAS
jgi:transposase-like protein